MEMILEAEMGQGWLVETFKSVYKNVPGDHNILKCFALIKKDGGDDPNHTALIIVRMFIQNSDRAKKDQKYIFGVRFYGFGDLATIDLISLDTGWHRDIVQEHAQKMNWILPELQSRDQLRQAYAIPLIAVGAHLNINDLGMIEPFSSSGDLGVNSLGVDVNEIVKHFLFTSHCSVENSHKGHDWITDLLDFMLCNKLRRDFYERFVAHHIAGGFTGQNFGGLLTMKVLDRSLEEDQDFFSLFFEELTDGLANKCMVIGAMHGMKK